MRRTKLFSLFVFIFILVCVDTNWKKVRKEKCIENKIQISFRFSFLFPNFQYTNVESSTKIPTKSVAVVFFSLTQKKKWNRKHELHYKFSILFLCLLFGISLSPCSHVAHMFVPCSVHVFTLNAKQKKKTEN